MAIVWFPYVLLITVPTCPDAAVGGACVLAEALFCFKIHQTTLILMEYLCLALKLQFSSFKLALRQFTAMSD